GRIFGRETERLQLEGLRRWIENTHHDVFAPTRRQARHAQVDLAAADIDSRSAILRETAFCYVQVGHNFETRADRRLHRFGHQDVLVHDAIDAHADAHDLFFRLEVNVARPLTDRAGDDLIHQTNDRRIVVLQF